MKLKTVKIVSKDSVHGYTVINESDFTNKHTRFVEKKETVKKEEKPAKDKSKK